MQGIRPYIPIVQAYRHPFKLPVASDTENQPNQKFPADVTLKNAASLTLDELQVSLALSELMLLNTAVTRSHNQHIFPRRIFLVWYRYWRDRLNAQSSS